MIAGEIAGPAGVGFVAAGGVVAPEHSGVEMAAVVDMLVGVFAGAGEVGVEIDEVDEAGFVAVAEEIEQVVLGGVEWVGLLAELEESVVVAAGTHAEAVVQDGKIEAAAVGHVAADSEEDIQLVGVAADETKEPVDEPAR
ncbi:hypothetical protein NW762_003609 [Fusarium torreyae]|uniref:Uncharacterized protein n=1 Tax=Fusarium torreyae TaxID=1237075 RepID=A0A9W8VJ89_9HYPO|nr:hypothetical protein NW762_003609 [Fusarium torreyae]